MNLKDFDDIYFQENLSFSLYNFLGEGADLNLQNKEVQALIDLHPFLLSKKDRNDFTILSEDKITAANNAPQNKYKLAYALIQICKIQNINPNVVLSKRLLALTDSFNRPSLLIELHQVLKLNDWMPLYIAFWTASDGCSLYMNEFKAILKNQDLPLIMKTYFPEEDYQEWLSLPNTIEVYRGAFESCKSGLSWSLDVNIALKFANTYIDMTNRGYSYIRAITQLNEHGMLLLNNKLAEYVSVYAITVNKNDCLLMSKRNEQELIIPNSANYRIFDVIKD